MLHRWIPDVCQAQVYVGWSVVSFEFLHEQMSTQDWSAERRVCSAAQNENQTIGATMGQSVPIATLDLLSSAVYRTDCYDPCRIGQMHRPVQVGIEGETARGSRD